MPLRREVTRALYLTDRGCEYLFSWKRLGIRRPDLVLDVGSGGHPFIRADVLCDKFVFDSTERPGQESLVIDRPFVIADAARLPFRDRTFDFSRTSHLLEHLDNPEQHLQELQRVSRRGLIITPAEAWERLYPISAHRWVVNQVDGCLSLREKPAVVFDEVLSQVFHHRLEGYGLSYFFNYFRDVFEVHYRWDGNIVFDVQRQPHDGGVRRTSAVVDQQMMHGPRVESHSARRRLKLIASKLHRRLYSAHYGVDIWSLVVCPACRSSLVRAVEECRCSGCGHCYPIYQERAPVLLL